MGMVLFCELLELMPCCLAGVYYLTLIRQWLGWPRTIKNWFDGLVSCESGRVQFRCDEFKFEQEKTMKKTLFMAAAMLISSTAWAATDHYVLRDGNHVHHLKVTNVGGEFTVSADVDFEPTAEEKGKHACSADVSGEAKSVAENELVMKKQIPGETRYCSLKVHLTPDGAKIEQSEECGYFAAGNCHFTSDGKELIKVK